MKACLVKLSECCHGTKFLKVLVVHAQTQKIRMHAHSSQAVQLCVMKLQNASDITAQFAVI